MWLILAWCLAVGSVGAVIAATVNLGRLRKQGRGDASWHVRRPVRRWRLVGTLGYTAGIANAATFFAAGAQWLAVGMVGVAVVLMVVMVFVAQEGAGEGEGAG